MKKNKPFLPHWFRYIDTERQKQLGVDLFKNAPFSVYEKESEEKRDMGIALFLDGVFYPTTTGASYHFMNLLTGLSKDSINVYLFRCYRGWEDPNIYRKLPFNTVCIDPTVFYDEPGLQANLLQKYSINTLVFDTSEVILYQGAYFKEHLGLKIVHDIQNIDHVLSEKGGLSPNIVKNQKQELITADKFVDLYWAKTELDRTQLQDVGIDSHKIRVRYPIIDTKNIHHSLRRHLGNPVKAIFLGNMFYSPNIGGLEILENTYRDCVRNDIYLEIDVVGEGDLLFLAKKFPNLNFKGKVDSISDLFLSYQLAFACPSYGSGISLKVLDYMAAGLPIIANSIGVRGHPSNISNYVIVDDSDSFYPAIRKLPIDSKLYTRLSSSSLDYIGKYFNPQKNIYAIKKDIRELNLDL
ncbi:glycosyltransferase [Patescibacteria group bacterium]|nr:glycosyltransferase [Patescibacteria group bacterium]